MIKKVGGTIITRFLMLIGAFITLILNTNSLGDSGLGTIALISLGILCVVALSNYVGGGAVIYLVPRIGVKRLVAPAYLWTLGISLIVFLFLHFFPIFKTDYLLEICVLSCLNGWFIFHMQILIGKEKIKEYNVLQLIQVWLLTLLVFIYYKVLDKEIVYSFIQALFYTFITVWLVSLAMVLKYFKGAKITGFSATYKEVFSYSKFSQSANVLQILNYRLNYVLMEKLIPGSQEFVRGSIGKFSIGTYMSEAVWNVSKSLSLVQYSRISNVDNEKYNTKLTTSFFKISILFTFLILIPILVIPESIYVWIFGESFDGIKMVLLLISPGILFNSGSVILSHYFSGVGKYKFNTIASGIGLLGTLICGYFLIQSFQLVGAAYTFSIAMLVQFIYLLISYTQHTDSSWRDLVFRKNDFSILGDIIKKIRRGSA